MATPGSGGDLRGMIMSRFMRPCVHLVANLLLPAQCGQCGGSLASSSFHPNRPLSRICDACLDQLLADDAPAWSLDGVPGCSLGWYEGALAGLMRQLKQEADHGLLLRLADRLSQPAGVDGCVLVAVPPEPVRRRERGWDPVASLCRHWARTWELEQLELLRRQRGSPPQRQLALGARLHRSPWLAGSSEHLQAASGKRLILVDDVCTSGATLRGCSAVLRNAGLHLQGYLSLLRTPMPGMRRRDVSPHGPRV